MSDMDSKPRFCPVCREDTRHDWDSGPFGWCSKCYTNEDAAEVTAERDRLLAENAELRRVLAMYEPPQDYSGASGASAPSDIRDFDKEGPL